MIDHDRVAMRSVRLEMRCRIGKSFCSIKDEFVASTWPGFRYKSREVGIAFSFQRNGLGVCLAISIEECHFDAVPLRSPHAKVRSAGNLKLRTNRKCASNWRRFSQGCIHVRLWRDTDR